MGRAIDLPHGVVLRMETKHIMLLTQGLVLHKWLKKQKKKNNDNKYNHNYNHQQTEREPEPRTTGGSVLGLRTSDRGDDFPFHGGTASALQNA